MKRRLLFLIFFALSLGVEVFLALFVRDSFFRPYFGDVLAVICVYLLMRMVFPQKPAFLSPFVTVFAFIVELVQLTELHRLFGSKVISVILGGTFDPADLICYTAGGLVCLCIDIKLRSRTDS